MAQPASRDDDEKPLDPAAERVRRKLVRFVAINLGILFAAVMAVLAAVVYKSGVSAPEEEASVPAAVDVLPSGEIALPSGARILSQSLSGNRLALHVTLAGGAQAIFLYDVAQGRILGRFDITGLPPET